MVDIGKNYERLKEDITTRLRDGTIACNVIDAFNPGNYACYFCLRTIEEHPRYAISCKKPFRGGRVFLDEECYQEIRNIA